MLTDKVCLIIYSSKLFNSCLSVKLNADGGEGGDGRKMR